MPPFWTQVGKTINGDQPGALFGYSIDQSSDGTIVAISSESFDGEDFNTTGFNTTNIGKVQVYQRKGKKRARWITMGSAITGWETGANQGNTVKLSDNGLVLAIGSDDTYFDAGHIDVYKWSNKEKQWNPYGNRLVGKQSDAEFGWAFDLTPDGKTIVCGAFGYDDFTENEGLTEIYTIKKGTWQLKGNQIIGFHQNITKEDSYYGWSVGIDEDGERVITSGPYDGYNETNYLTGAVKVYDYDEGSGNWTQAGQTLFGSENGDEFGISVAMSKDGSTIAIGAGCYYYCEAYYTDYVVTYEWDDEDELWVLSGAIEPEAEDVGFGISINLSNDGTKLALATPGQVNGDARVFAHDSNSTWTKVGQDLVINELTEDSDYNHIVSLSGDGENLVVGSIDGGEDDVGQVMAYKLATDPAKSPVTGCVDAHRGVAFRWPTGKKVTWRNCKYVSRDKKKRCEEPEVAAMCPLTCGKCFEDAYACEDGPQEWKNGKFSCELVAKNPEKKCKGNLVPSVCRKTCNTPMYDMFCSDK